MHWKNKLLKKILPARPKAFKVEDPREIFIVSTTALGDTLWAIPALRAIKETFPNTRITFLTSTIGQQALLHCPYIDELVAIGKPCLLKLFILSWRWRKKTFDTTIYLHASQRAVIALVAFLRSGYRIANANFNKGLDWLFHELVDDSGAHEIERRLELVSAIGAKAYDVSLELPLNQEDIALAEQFLKTRGFDPLYPLVCLHPGASKTFKQWPPEYFGQIGRMLHEHLGAQVVITGSEEEEDLVALVAGKIPKAIKISGDLPLRSLASVYKNAQMVITNDTGPLHVSIGVGAKVIALFSPTSPKRCGPYLANHCHIIYKRKACTPCLQKACPNPFCMRQIGVDEVFQTALRLYYQKNH